MLSRLFAKSSASGDSKYVKLEGGSEDDDLRNVVDFHITHLNFESNDAVDANFLHLALQVSLLETNINKLKASLESTGGATSIKGWLRRVPGKIRFKSLRKDSRAKARRMRSLNKKM